MDMSKYVRIPNPFSLASITRSAPPMDSGGKNPFLRCFLPQSVTTSSDALRQFYATGVPQYRIIPPLVRGVGQNNS